VYAKKNLERKEKENRPERKKTGKQSAAKRFSGGKKKMEQEGNGIRGYHPANGEQERGDCLGSKKKEPKGEGEKSKTGGPQRTVKISGKKKKKNP